MKYSKYLPLLTDEKLESLKTSEAFSAFRRELFQSAEEKKNTTPPYVRFSELNLFAENGDRKTFERVFGDYANRIHIFAAAYLLSEDESYLPHLADALWSYCDFETWSLQAHCNLEDTVTRREYIDLNAASIGAAISEYLYLLEDKLPKRLCLRVHHELRARIVDAFKKHQNYWYFNTTNNWASVIAAGVFCVYLYEATEEEIAQQLPVLMKLIDNYLLGFDDEGCCKEGYGYWTYGFTHFCYFAELLRAYTNGEVNLFKSEKVRAIAHFQENASIDERHAIPFSDCNFAFNPAAYLTHFLKREYPDVVVPPLSLNYITRDIRLISWMDADIPSQALEQRSHIFHENQWFIYKSPSYNIACKAGNNVEFHNHNDVGSFVISKNNTLSFLDPGCGHYTKQYFSNLRYTFVESSSRGHSVPIINGKHQYTTEKKATVYTAQPDEYAFSIHQAYEDDTLVSAKRHFRCEKDAVVLTDTFAFAKAPTALTERFVSLEKPVLLAPGRVQVAQTILEYDAECLDVVLGGEPHTARTDGVISIFFTDLIPKQLHTNITVSVRFV